MSLRLKMNRMYLGLTPSDTPEYEDTFLLRFSTGALVMGVIPSASSADVPVPARVSVASLLGVEFATDGTAAWLASGGDLGTVCAFVKGDIGSAICIEVTVSDVGEFVYVGQGEVVPFMDKFSSC